MASRAWSAVQVDSLRIRADNKWLERKSAIRGKKSCTFVGSGVLWKPGCAVVSGGLREEV